jgi:murein DD-endopeptidase MepM/ murein hydrolase activator NlpD
MILQQVFFQTAARGDSVRFDSKVFRLSVCCVAVAVIVIVSIAHWVLVSSANSANISPSFSLFTSEDEYLKYIREKVSFDGLELKVVEVPKGSNFWKIARDYGVNIDTLISANPFWENLNARTRQSVIVPSQKGVLHFVRDLRHISSLRNMYGVDDKKIIVQNLSIFERLFGSFSDEKTPIAVFIRNIKPDESMMTQSLAKQFSVREMFRSPLGGRYSSYFGRRLDPIVHTDQFHNGVDIAAPHGTPVGAACDGVVSETGWMGGFGNAVVIEHRNGFRSLYGHLSQIGVRPGQNIKAGQFIGRVGSTGWSTGPHLHFTLSQNGRYLNPMQVLW